MIPSMVIPDQVFCIRIAGIPVWKIVVDGKVVATEWYQKGPAQAGLEVEQRRAAKRRAKEATSA